VECYVCDTLCADQAKRWEEFVAASPSRHYKQAPRWAEVERRDDRFEVRRPLYFWCESDGELVLTGLAVRRRLPGTRYSFYEFNRGPVFRDQEILNDWLEWALPTLRRDAVRLRLAPQWLLAEGGDDVETVLERHGFRRRRMMGMWSTLLVDISANEDAVLHGFRRQARQNIAKCQKAGLTVLAEVDDAGCETLSGMHADMALRVGVRPLPVSAIERVSRCWANDGADGTVLIARENDRPVSGALVISYAGTAYLQTMASATDHGGLPTSHLLVWEVIRWAKAHRCDVMDFCGYSLVAQPGESLAGVNQFKRGFAPGTEPTRLVAPHEILLRPVLHEVYAAARRAETKYRRRRDGRTQGRESPRES